MVTLKRSVVWFLLLIVAGCGKTAQDADLVQANNALRGMISSRMMAKSCFYVVYPEGKSSEFITYLFSDLGAAEWPVAMDEFEAEQMKSIGQAVFPPSVAIAPLSRQNVAGKKLVLEADDGNGQVIAKGYLADSDEVNLQANLPLVKVAPEPGVKDLCESNIDMGMSPF